MGTKTDHLDRLVKEDQIAQDLLVAVTKERDFYEAGTPNFVRFDTLVTELTAKTANGALAIAAQTAIETN